nr:MAG TPA: tail fiber protein [Caudoviricetes sp.]
MDFKTGKLHKIIREFKKGNGRYEINGIDLENTVFLYREKTSPFIPIPKGNYRTVSNDNKNTLIVDDYINNKAVEFQIISIFNAQASKYLEKFPELSMVVEHTNKIVDDINNIIGYLNSVGVKTDSKYQTQILTPLEPSSTWYMNADGVIETLPLDDFNKKFKEIIENISETADEKAQEQVRKRLEQLKEEIENFKNTKTNEISIIGNNSKKELESKMSEINNKFNAIAGGQINPSFIQDAGEKRIGEYYLDKNTGKLFRCIRTTSSIVNSAEYFKDMSINSIVDRLENLNTTKEEKTKLSLTQINNVNLNSITESGFYVSSGWGNNISGVPQELDNNESRAFYLVVFSLEGGSYCQQILYSFKGLIFYRAVTGSNRPFGQWRKLT